MEAFKVRGELGKPVESQFQGDGLDGCACPDARSGLVHSEFIQPNMWAEVLMGTDMTAQSAFGDSDDLGHGENAEVGLEREFFPVLRARLSALHTHE